MSGVVSARAVHDTTEEAELRRAILAAAIEELRVWSFERFSAVTVADRAGVAPEVIDRLWRTTDQLIVDALATHGRQIVVVPNTGSLRGDLTGYLASLAQYVNTAVGRSLLRTAVVGPNNWAPADARRDTWKTIVDATRVIFDRAKGRNEIRADVDHAAALQLAAGPVFMSGLYSNDPIDTARLPTQIADMVWRALRREA
jgi:hypothetical protein